MADDREGVVAANRRYWDRSTPEKMAHGSYPLAAFRAGESTLFAHEREEVGSVSGRSLLHLQCNNGLETLSWARAGADAVGLDVSGESLRVARDLAAEAGLDAAFVQCDVYDAADALDRRFDVVYTSRGVLGWLPDLDEWADAVAGSLADDGRFYLFEGHPLVHAVDGDLDAVRSYFETGPHERTESDFGADERHFLTHHRLGEVLTALASAGLSVEFLREHPFDYWHRWDRMVRDDAGRWRLPGDPIPLSFSLLATPA